MAEAKITRAEAAAIVNSQLCWASDLPNTYRQGHTYHYGRQDLRYLLDAIYGPPQSDDEMVTGEDLEAIARHEAKVRAQREARSKG